MTNVNVTYAVCTYRKKEYIDMKKYFLGDDFFILFGHSNLDEMVNFHLIVLEHKK